MRAAVSLSVYLSVGGGIGVLVAAPDHVLAQLLAHKLHLVLLELGPFGVEEGAAVLVLGDPLSGEGAVLDVGEDKLDSSEEYGHTICCHDFRKKETEFLRSVVLHADQEYAAPDVKYRMVIAHYPFLEGRTDPKFNIEREIYEEHQKRIARANRYIEAIKNQKFPVDAERLVKNYFKTAQKDAEGAFKALTQNPAIFAPIDFSKIKPRLFGLLKVKPQDGIRINRLIGDFLKKLKA